MIKTRKEKRKDLKRTVLGFFCLSLLIAFAASDCFFVGKKTLSPNKNTYKKANDIEKAQNTATKPQPTALDLDLTYDYIRQTYSGFSKHLNYGLYNGQPCVKIGYGTPITADELKTLPYDNKHYDMTGFVENVQQHYDNVLKEKAMDYSVIIPDDVIRFHTKKFLQEREAYYVDLCKEYGFEYKDLPYKARAAVFCAVFCIDAATGFKKEDENGNKRGVATYKKFFENGLKKQDWITSGKEAAVSDRVFKENNPNTYEDVARIFNINMIQLFGDLDKEKQKYIDQQNYLKQQGKSL